jgi:hypothetical protein
MVARTPQERQAVDWNLVYADATNGLAADFVLQLNPSGGWDYAWLASHYTTGAANWHQMSPYIIGMADSSGAYDAWLATPRGQRTAFLIRTRDARFPAGDDRATQNTNSPLTPPANSRLYFRNRPSGEDQPNVPFGLSFYSFNRWRALFDASRIGPWVTFSKVENDMLGAEAAIRLGRVADALPLINASRTRNNLPAIVSTSATDPVPGGASCVPRVPVGPNYTSTACGTVLEAMKWEKRMESAYSSWGTWFFDMRGWGDLAEGSVIQWPTPYQELDSRRLPIYSLGGVGRDGGAGVSTYRFGTGDR